MKSKFIFLLLIPLVSLTIILLFLFFLLSMLSSDGKNLSDQEMIDFFLSHTQEFQEMNISLLEYKKRGLNRIDDTWTDPKDIIDIGMTTQELEKIRNDLKNLSIPRGIVAYGEGIEYLFYTAGISIGGTSKGFLYSETSPKNYYKYNDESLPEQPYTSYKQKIIPNRGSYGIYIEMTPNWYYFEEYED